MTQPLLPEWHLDACYVLQAIDGGFIRDMMAVVYDQAGMPVRWITDKEIAALRAEALRSIGYAV